MTFPDALKKLAELEHERFWLSKDKKKKLWLSPGGETFYWRGENDAVYCMTFSDGSLGQDSIDNILALVEWEYQVSANVSGYGFEAWVGKWHEQVELRGYPFSTKLDAARAALVAVVEELIEQKERKK
jgi:hypothetical protein